MQTHMLVKIIRYIKEGRNFIPQPLLNLHLSSLLHHEWAMGSVLGGFTWEKLLKPSYNHLHRRGNEKGQNKECTRTVRNSGTMPRMLNPETRVEPWRSSRRKNDGMDSEIEFLQRISRWLKDSLEGKFSFYHNDMKFIVILNIFS